MSGTDESERDWLEGLRYEDKFPNGWDRLRDLLEIEQAVRRLMLAEDAVSFVEASLTDDDDNAAMQRALRPVVTERMAANLALRAALSSGDATRPTGDKA